MGKVKWFLIDFLLLPCAIGVFNAYLIYPWFLGQSPANLGSIEVSYVSMAKFLVSNFPHLSWAPFWYLGFPFHVFYTPILPFFTALLHVFGDFPLWQSYRILTGLGLVLAPVSLFFLVLTLSQSRLAALSSAFLYSVAPNLFYFILPSGEVRADVLSEGFLDPRRIVNLMRWGEGPHLFSLIFVPLAGLFFFKTLNGGRRFSLILAAFFTALTAMTNAIGLYALILFIVSIFLVETFFDDKTREGSLGKTILIALLTYGLLAFWYNLTFVKTFFAEGGGALQNWINMLPWGMVGLVGGVFILLFLLRIIFKDKALSSVFLWFLFLFGIVATYYFSAPPQVWQERIELAPQALRYTVEVDLALAALVGLLVAWLVRKIANKNKFAGKVCGIAVASLVAGASVVYGFLYAPSAWEASGKEVKLEDSAEKKMADFLSKRVDSQKGERVFLAGNYAFYLNYFTDVWQLRGGLYQAKTHPWPEHIYYQLRVGKDPEIAQAWLEIINAKYLVVIPGGEYEQKEKFKILPLATAFEDGSLVYRVPLANSSPVKIINLATMNSLVTPKKADDKEPILAYATWLGKRQNQTAFFQKANNDSYKIKATIEEGEGILVQMTADQGWRATSAQGSINVKKDPLGFLVLVPERRGELEIILSHGRSWDIWLGYFITLVTLGLPLPFLLGKFESASDVKT